ncbi:hypothetical protein ACFV2L_00790 [Streptomyces sp. NPDC059687]
MPGSDTEASATTAPMVAAYVEEISAFCQAGVDVGNAIFEAGIL